MFEKTKQKIDAKKQAKEGERLDREREEKCMPLAKFILREILDADLTLGEKSKEQYFEEHKPVVESILAKFLEEDVKLSDTTYIKQLMIEMIDNVDILLTQSIGSSLKLSDKALWGVDRDDKTFSMLDKVLKDYGEKLKEEKKN